MLRDVCKKDLIHDDAADNETHDRAKTEHISDRRRSCPIVLFSRDKFFARENFHVALKGVSQRRADRLRRRVTRQMN